MQSYDDIRVLFVSVLLYLAGGLVKDCVTSVECRLLMDENSDLNCCVELLEKCIETFPIILHLRVHDMIPTQTMLTIRRTRVACVVTAIAFVALVHKTKEWCIHFRLF